MHDRMNPVIKAQWLDALRSGKYEQGDGALRNTMLADEYAPTPHFAYCCLGVLCDVMHPEKWDGIANDDYCDLPSDAICAEAGLPVRRTSDELFGRESSVSILAHMNDSGRSFLEIADWIAENL